ncbi:MAG: hypothetical protein IT336_14220 [Thermomicrobiales bacterium]|nr:hypothetical protein [Thermomicrobiales bacterium]
MSQQSSAIHRMNGSSMQAGVDPTPPGANRGQVVLMFALFLTALLGILGLAIDLGYSFAQRRTIQGAADLAATAGAQAIARYYDGQESDANDRLTNALTDVNAIVADNHITGTETTLESCTYLDRGGEDVGECGINVPANATGVHVSVSETHRTFFIKVIPGAPVFVTTRATASAQLERMDLAGMDSPFLVCGYFTELKDPVDGEDEMDILVKPSLDVDSPDDNPDDWSGEDWEDAVADTRWSDDDYWDSWGYQVNPDALGQTFVLAGGSRSAIARCGAGVNVDGLDAIDGASAAPGNPYQWKLAENLEELEDDGELDGVLEDLEDVSGYEATTTYGSRWRGLADKTANSGKRIVLVDASTSTWWNALGPGSVSTTVSTLTNKVHGIEGCGELAVKPFDCIMLVPIATEYDKSLRRFKVTKVMAFRVFRDDSDLNRYYGTLLDDYIVYGASVPLASDRAPCERDCGSVFVVRLAD